MKLPEQLKTVAAIPPAWLRGDDRNAVVVSSRVRLARNLAGRVFPEQMDEVERVALWVELRDLLAAEELLDDPLLLDMGGLSELARQLVFERHLISREHLRHRKGGGLATRRDESMSIMVNEEDHLRLQCFEPALGLVRAWERIDRLDTAISALVDYAYSDRFGFLTCCPTNVGTGMRASAMLHLPALSLLDEIRPVINGLSKIGLMVRGMWGEGSEIAGHMFQVSNQITLGKVEVEIIDYLAHIVTELSEHEENARKRLLATHSSLIKDYVGRARGVLENAHILSTKEAFDMLSAVRLGIEAGLIDGVGRDRIDELFLMVQPAHLQVGDDSLLGSAERDEIRARIVRNELNLNGKESESEDE